MNARGALLLVLALPGLAACRDEKPRAEVRPPGVPSARPVATPPPRVLYLPDAGRPSAPAPAVVAAPVNARCPPEMVEVRGAFCIDRFEASLVDRASGERLSPYYPPSPEATRREYRRWQLARSTARTALGKELAVPAPSEWALSAKRFEPMATSIAASVPNGYLSGQVAGAVCGRAGKRLCTVEEWVAACRGHKNTGFPYGQRYQVGRCNVFRETHPARVLHGDPSIGHLDPRLNLVREGDAPLLLPTGEMPDCASEWDGGAAYDMVGNLDEWVEDSAGTFVGGFYARATQKGCDARVEVHPVDYYDYSLGTRCCCSL